MRTADVTFAPEPGASAIETLVRRAWPHHRGAYRPPQGLARRVETFAEANHGRWIARCPFCPGALLASEADPRFFCVDCVHLGTRAEGKWIPVVWPASRSAIADVLDRRPDPATRNFDPRTETMQDLIDENERHGVG